MDMTTSPPHVTYLEGWYDEESDGRHTFRWMTRKGSIVLENVGVPGRKYLRFLACRAAAEERVPTLTVSFPGGRSEQVQLEPSPYTYTFPFDDEGKVEVGFELDVVGHAPGDPRELGMAMAQVELVPPTGGIELLEGCYDEEHCENGPFRWTKKKAVFDLPNRALQQNRYIALDISSDFKDGTQRLTVSLDGKELGEIPLLFQWHTYSLEHGCAATSSGNGTGHSELVLTLDKVLVPGQGDKRELGMKLQGVSFHDDDVRHQTSQRMRENAVLNYQEMLQGKEVLESYPSTLGIDLFGKCNIKPPCVYCMWDESKALEGDLVDAVVDADVLKGYGPFFTNARHMVNCSIGEPLLHPGLAGILESFHRNNKLVEIATNGQALSSKQIKALAGKRICLYISLDAATKKTYSILRNDRWDSVVEHLHELNRVRKQHDNLPRILMVFMPMRANMHEVEDYFRLCRDTEADSLVLRPLNYYDDPGVVVERAGYVFDYKKELLTRDEIDAVIARCMELSVQYNVPVSNQFAYS